MRTFFVGISSWIIQDGNYGDFHVGEDAKFALEFCPQTLRLTQAGTSLERSNASRYRVSGRVVYSSQSAWVLDFGIMAYHNQEPPQIAKKGASIEGEIYLGIDPFFYAEELYALRGMPALQYEWRIKSIYLETTPWLHKRDETGRTILTRDEQQESYISVEATNAWHDDEGNAHYVLECEKTG